MRNFFTLSTIVILLITVLTPAALDAQTGCSGATDLSQPNNCQTGDLQNASSAGLAGACSGANTTTYSVWYKFTASSTSPIIVVSNWGSNLNTNTYLEVFSGSCGSLTSMSCQNITSGGLSLSGISVGTTYYLRVYTTNAVTGNPANRRGFTICVQDPPSNDDCSGAVSLVSNTSCSNTSSTLIAATPSTGIPLGCAAAGTYNDVWFSFVAASTTETVALSSLGSNISNPALQLYSGSCGSLSSVACGTTSLTASGLSIGTTYYVRVSNVNTAVTSAGTFNICVTHPAPSIPSIDYSKSYINVSKGSTGGTVNVGDTLEMRATLVIRSGTADSLSFTDTIFNTKGLRLIPGSIALRTNEGKIYGSGFTDAFDSDAGWFTTNGLDTIVRINFGAGASSSKRGSLSNTSRPSVFGGTCIIMATYRVVVYADYNTKINFKTGALTYRNTATSVMNTITFNCLPKSRPVSQRCFGCQYRGS